MEPFHHVFTPIDFPGRPVAASFGEAIAGACGARLSPLPLDSEAEPEGEILDYAERHGVDLIVLATHGRRLLDRLLLGSLTEDVARKAPCSVLAVRDFDDGSTICLPTLSNVLCAVDRGDAAHGIVEIAAALARATGGRLTVHHVIDEGAWPARGDEERIALGETAHVEVARLLARHIDPGQTVDTLVTFGLPRDEISRVAHDRGADLLVLGAHSMARAGQRSFGSTADHLLRALPCPTLIARTGRAERRRDDSLRIPTSLLTTI